MQLEASLPFCKTNLSDFNDMARNLEVSVEDINRVEIKDLINNFDMPDWNKDLNEDNSNLNKLLHSRFFKRKERFESENYIDM